MAVYYIYPDTQTFSQCDPSETSAIVTISTRCNAERTVMNMDRCGHLKSRVMYILS